MTSFFILGLEPDPLKGLERALLDGSYKSTVKDNSFLMGAHDTLYEKNDEKRYSDIVVIIDDYLTGDDTLSPVLEAYYHDLQAKVGEIDDKESLLTALDYILHTPITVDDTTFPSILYAQETFNTTIQYFVGSHDVRTEYKISTGHYKDILSTFHSMEGRPLTLKDEAIDSLSHIEYLSTYKKTELCNVSYLYPIKELTDH
jgi:hypothetical protein